MTPSPSTTRPATSTDVARKAGVSRATVSHVLNGQVDRFPEETRRKVLDAAEALSYVPSPAGRSLASGRSDTIVVLLPNSTFSVILQDIVDEVAESTAIFGANVVLEFVGEDLAATVESLLRLRPMAILDFSGLTNDAHRQRFDAMRTIVVPRNSGPDAHPEIDALPDQIAEAQVEALLASGPRPMYFAQLADQRTDVFGPIRAAGVSRAAQRRGLPCPEIIAVPLELIGATTALKTAVQDGKPVAIACYNDDVAMALLAAARDLGLSVPADVSIVGVDHTQLGQLWHPRLTTVRVEIKLVVEYAVHELVTALDSSTKPLATNYENLVVLIPGATT